MAGELKTRQASTLGTNAMVALSRRQLDSLGGLPPLHGFADLGDDHGLALEREPPEAAEGAHGHPLWVGPAQERPQSLLTGRGPRGRDGVRQFGISRDSSSDEAVEVRRREAGLSGLAFEHGLRVQALGHGAMKGCWCTLYDRKDG